MRVRELPPTGAAGRAGTDPPAIGAGGEHRARPPAQRCHGAQPPARGQRSRAGAGHPAECCGGAGRGHGWAEPVAGPRQSPTACHAGADPKRNSARRTLGGTVRLGVRAWQYRPGADGTRGSRQTDPSRSPTHACPQRRSAPGGARPFRRPVPRAAPTARPELRRCRLLTFPRLLLRSELCHRRYNGNNYTQLFSTTPSTKKDGI